MKKILIILSLCAMTISSVQARDYAKLQVKEMKHAQKYGSTQRYFNTMSQDSLNKNTIVSVQANIKDPKIMDFGLPEKVDNAKYNAKIKSDNEKYKKIAKSFGVRTVDNYNAQAKGEDYYTLYRVAEKIIRANNLDYQNWRIGVYRDSEAPNAFSTNNLICISTSLYDTFSGNEDALAMVLGHEFAHALLGHQQRSAPTLARLSNMSNMANSGEEFSELAYAIVKRKYLIDSKNMEYAADAEGAKLAMKAGYDVDKGMDVIAYLETLPHINDFRSDHPNPNKRKENLIQNKSLYIEEAWKEAGKYNIYNSDVLEVNQSSDRKSIVINGNPRRLNSGEYYHPETPAQIYARCAYKYYVNGQFAKAVEYFEELFKIDSSNAPAYLYASYANEALYKNVGKKAYLNNAKMYAEKAKSLWPDNKYILEQVDSL